MRAQRYQSGFSAAEAVIALVVVCVLAGVALVSGPSHIRATSDAFAESAAIRVAEGVLEEAAARPRELIDGMSTVTPEPPDALDLIAVTRTVMSREAGLLEVAADVAWRSNSGHERTLRLVTLIAVPCDSEEDR